MFHHFKFFPFLAGLVVGAIVFFYFKPESKERVVKWPRPENCGKYTYRDRNGLCYTFESQIVDCDKVKDSIQAYALE
jgi:hypothetical protein